MRAHLPSGSAVAIHDEVQARLTADPHFADFQPWSSLHRPDRPLDADWTEGCRSPRAYREGLEASTARNYRQVAICLDPQEQLVVLETWVEEGFTFASLHEFGEDVNRAVTHAETARAAMRVSHPVFRHPPGDERFHLDGVVIRLGLNQRRARRVADLTPAVRDQPGLVDLLMATGLRADELRAVRALVQGSDESRAAFTKRISADLIASLAESALLEEEATELRRAAADLAARPSPGESIFQDG